jgi:hypothetical protein
LMAPLNGTITLEKMDEITVFVADQLHFQVPRLLNVLFNKYVWAAKRRQRFAACLFEAFAACTKDCSSEMCLKNSTFQTKFIVLIWCSRTEQGIYFFMD